MAVSRSAIVKAARGWVGTPFAHQGRIKGRAVDCVGLVLCVAEELGIDGACSSPESWTRQPKYSQYGPEPFRGKVFNECVERLEKVQDSESIKVGDILSLRVPLTPCHVAIVSEHNGVLYMIHAYNGGTNKKCCEHVLDSAWRRRIAGVFRFPGVEA